jgi:cytochrome c-type biogenesis protein CcmH
VTRLRSFTLWCVSLVAVFALVLVTHGSTPSQQSRIARLETLVKCPACDDISVAQSNATSAIAVRNEITQRVRAGASDNAILTSLESRYGSSILLSPSTSGVGILLWAVPLAVVAVAVIAALRLARRR